MHRAMEISQTTQHAVYCNYHGHTNEMCIYFDINGFSEDSKTKYIKGKSGSICVYLDSPINDILEFFERANIELDKLEARTKAA